MAFFLRLLHTVRTQVFGVLVPMRVIDPIFIAQMQVPEPQALIGILVNFALACPTCVLAVIDVFLKLRSRSLIDRWDWHLR